MKKLKWISQLAFWLVVIGGINWGLISLFKYDLVQSLLSDTWARVVFGLVGISAVYALFSGKLNR